MTLMYFVLVASVSKCFDAAQDGRAKTSRNLSSRKVKFMFFQLAFSELKCSSTGFERTITFSAVLSAVNKSSFQTSKTQRSSKSQFDIKAGLHNPTRKASILSGLSYPVETAFAARYLILSFFPLNRRSCLPRLWLFYR